MDNAPMTHRMVPLAGKRDPDAAEGNPSDFKIHYMLPICLPALLLDTPALLRHLGGPTHFRCSFETTLFEPERAVIPHQIEGPGHADEEDLNKPRRTYLLLLTEHN